MLIMIRIFNTRILIVSPGVTKGFIKGEALRLLRKNSSKLTFKENMKKFEKCLLNRGHSASVVEKHLSEVKFSDRKASLKQKNRDARTRLLPFVTQYCNDVDSDKLTKDRRLCSQTIKARHHRTYGIHT